MRPDDVLMELAETESAVGDAIEERWHVIHASGRTDNVFPYAKAFRLASSLARQHGVDIYRRRLPQDVAELADSFRPEPPDLVSDREPTVGDVMTRDVWVVGEDEPLRRARGLMVEHGIRHLPVLRGQQLVGLLTDRDVKRALNPELGLPSGNELFVQDVCVYETYVVPPTEPLERVLRHMALAHIGSALVATDTRVLGIFTSTDACRVFADHLAAHRRSLVESGR
ncbi:MAG: CBS domain-containing protein [Vicinamibacterales bacterium]